MLSDNSALASARNRYHCGFYGKAEECLTVVEENHMDSLVSQDVDLLKTKISLAKGNQIDPNYVSSQDCAAVVHIAIAMNPNYPKQQRQQSCKWLAKNEQEIKDPSTKAMIQFTLTYTSLNGNIPWSSTDIVEGINFAIQNLSEIECEESSLMQMLLLILGDRLDLAESAYNRMHIKDDDSVVAQLGQIYLNICKQNWIEAILLIEDICSSLGLSGLLLFLIVVPPAVSEKSSRVLLSLKGFCQIHRGQYAEAIDNLKLAMQLDQQNDPTILMNLVVAYQNSHQHGEAELLEQTLEPSHPYLKALIDLRQAVGSSSAPQSSD